MMFEHQTKADLWKAFQQLMGKPQPQATPVGVNNGVMFPSMNPMAPNFLAQLEKFGQYRNRLQATPMPAQQATPALRSNAGFLPPDSYASALRSMVQNYQR